MAADSPLVHRTVRTGGVFLAVAATQFVAVLLWLESRTSGFPRAWTGLTSLGGPSGWTALAFDASLVTLGLLGAFGLLLAWSAFDARPSRGLGLLFLVLGSVAVLATGVLLALGHRAPSYALPAAVEAAWALVGLGLVVISTAMHRHGRWRVSSGYTFLTGAVLIGGAVLTAARFTPYLGPGGVERLVGAAALAWALVEGLHLAVLHRFAPGFPLKVATA